MMKVTTRLLALTLLFVSNFVVYHAAMAQDLEEALTNHPNPEQAAYYLEHAEEIQALRAQAMEGESAERLQALEELSRLYPDAAVTTAIKLVNDDTLEIAVASAELLAASIAMSDHPTMLHGDFVLLPYQEYVVARHEAARAALLGTLMNSRAQVRDIAAATLASLSDEEALRSINEGVDQGLYSETVAINYFGLANSAIGASYIEPYLVSGSDGARIGAVMYLGGVPKYQERIRDEVLFNTGLHPSIRGAAAGTLSVYDLNYRNYALLLTLDPTLPASLYVEVVEGYIKSLQADNALNSANARILRTAIENYSGVNADARVGIEQIESILDQYLE